jgi:hypothetical protein
LARTHLFRRRLIIADLKEAPARFHPREKA